MIYDVPIVLDIIARLTELGKALHLNNFRRAPTQKFWILLFSSNPWESLEIIRDFWGKKTLKMSIIFLICN